MIARFQPLPVPVIVTQASALRYLGETGRPTAARISGGVAVLDLHDLALPGRRLRMLGNQHTVPVIVCVAR